MRAIEIWQMTPDEIRQRLEDAREELFNLRFQWRSGQLRDNNRLTQVKRDIARMLTILREREFEQEEEVVA